MTGGVRSLAAFVGGVAAASARRQRSQRRTGFTLIELAFVLAIIGVLATIAFGAVRGQVFKSRRAEAIAGLDAIHKAQLAYRGATGTYGDDFDVIGFALDGGARLDARTIRGRYYVFTVQALSENGVPAMNFQALATGDIDPSDDVLDILMIENRLTVVE